MKRCHVLFLLLALSPGCRALGEFTPWGRANFTSASRPAGAEPAGESQPAEMPSAVAVQSPATLETSSAQATPELLPVVFDQPREPAPLPPPQETLPPPAPPEGAWTLAQLEQMALASNPTIMQAEAQVRALRGNWVQVGLPPNPRVGYSGEEIGDDGTAGKQGMFISQQFIRGNKLELNRAVASREILRAEQQFSAQRLRVLTDVRTRYYEVLVAQRRREVVAELLAASEQAVEISGHLAGAGEIPQAGLLQAELEMQTARVLVRQARNGEEAAWRRLATVVGRSEVPPGQLEGDLDALSTSALGWEDELERLLHQSPEMATAAAGLERARWAVNRAQAEVVPNVTVQAGVQYDNASGYTISAVQLGLPLPLWNRNQGGIRQAQSELMAAEQNMQRVELDLEQRLAQRYREYTDARFQVESYSREILPKAQETFSVVSRLFSLGEAGYLDLLTSQRTYFQTNLAYLDALGELWRAQREIEGLLLENSLGAQGTL